MLSPWTIYLETDCNEERYGGVDTGLYQIEGQYGRKQHGVDNAGWDAHKKRRYKVIGSNHNAGHGDRTADEPDDSTHARMLHTVNDAGHNNKRGGGEHVHDKAIDTAVGTDGQRLDTAGDNR